MGQVIIEVPQEINRIFRLKDRAQSEKLLRDLEQFEQNGAAAKTSAIIPPRRNSLAKDLAAATGIWADRPESAEEIAGSIRDRNNGKND